MTSPWKHKPGTQFCPSERELKGEGTRQGLKTEASFYFSGQLLAALKPLWNKKGYGRKARMEWEVRWRGEGIGQRGGGRKAEGKGKRKIRTLGDWLIFGFSPPPRPHL